MAKEPRRHVLLVVAPYYTEIVENLVRGTTETLAAAGVTWERVDVAGAFEIPAAIAIVHDDDDDRFDGYVGLGCVIRGETSHYDHICNEVSHAMQMLAVKKKLAIGFGLLTCENGEQARVRADPARKNKGGETARAVISMMDLKASLAKRKS